MAEENVRQQVVEFYTAYNPDKLSEVDQILDVYAGKEEVLVNHLHRKYGVAQDDENCVEEYDTIPITLPRPLQMAFEWGAYEVLQWMGALKNGKAAENPTSEKKMKLKKARQPPLERPTNFERPPVFLFESPPDNIHGQSSSESPYSPFRAGLTIALLHQHESLCYFGRNFVGRLRRRRRMNGREPPAIEREEGADVHLQTQVLNRPQSDGGGVTLLPLHLYIPNVDGVAPIDMGKEVCNCEVWTLPTGTFASSFAPADPKSKSKCPVEEFEDEQKEALSKPPDKLAAQDMNEKIPQGIGGVTVALSVVILPFSNDGSLLVTQRANRGKSGTYNNIWVFPGGHVDKEENLRRAAVRELHEETGVIVHERGLCPLALWQAAVVHKMKQYCIVFFEAHIDQPSAEIRLSLQTSEVSRAGWIPSQYHRFIATKGPSDQWDGGNGRCPMFGTLKVEDGKFSKEPIDVHRLLPSLEAGGEELAGGHRFALAQSTGHTPPNGGLL